MLREKRNILNICFPSKGNWLRNSRQRRNCLKQSENPKFLKSISESERKFLAKETEHDFKCCWEVCSLQHDNNTSFLIIVFQPRNNWSLYTQVFINFHTANCCLLQIEQKHIEKSLCDVKSLILSVFKVFAFKNRGKFLIKTNFKQNHIV
jgi:hypothetical protein